jgi:hypothetical protein
VISLSFGLVGSPATQIERKCELYLLRKPFLQQQVFLQLCSPAGFTERASSLVADRREPVR